jgi:hypothetical protein
MSRADHSRRAVLAILEAARHEGDFSDWLAATLGQVAGQLGSGYALIEGRPGSWEADLVSRLLPPDEYLPGPIGGRKLTDAQAQDVIWRWDDGFGGVTQAVLAKEYGVSVSAVSRLVRGVTWKWLKRPTF